MEHIAIKEYLQTSGLFTEQEDSLRRRFDYIKGGVKIAHIWFKYTLGGWNMIIGKEKERHHIDSVDKLKSLLNL
jgi:hypothetical protein